MLRLLLIGTVNQIRRIVLMEIILTSKCMVWMIKVQDDITMSAWVNIKDKSDDGNFNGSYGRVIYAPNEYYEMYLNWNGGDGINNRDPTARSGGHGYSLGQSITEGQWKNIVYTYTSDTLRIYVDGVLSRKEFGLDLGSMICLTQFCFIPWCKRA